MTTLVRQRKVKPGDLEVLPTRIVDMAAVSVLKLVDAFEVPSETTQRPDGAAVVTIRPAGDGEVLVEVVAPRLMARAVMPGEASRPVAVPTWALKALRKRHADAERITVDERDGLLMIRSLGSDAAVTMSGAEGLEMTPLPEVLVSDEAVGLQGRVAPRAVQRAITAVQLLKADAVELRVSEEGMVAVELRFTGSECRGWLAIARLVPREAI